MIAVGDTVYIIPSKSLKFGGRWGRVVGINDQSRQPVQIEFSDNGMPYWFDYYEFVTTEQYTKNKEVPVSCNDCGTDITGQFVGICEECDMKKFEEAIESWQK